MAIENFTSHSAPFGEAVPAGTPHAVSASLPRMKDVQRLFRDRDTAAWSQLETTYPRFGDHPFVKQAVELQDVEDGRVVTALSSPGAAEDLLAYDDKGSLKEARIIIDGVMTFLSYTTNDWRVLDDVALFKKQTGSVPSSRRAEDYLAQKGVIENIHQETVDTDADQNTVSRTLAEVYAPRTPATILANSGMSAANAAIGAVHEVRNMEADNGTWIILGPLYRDSADLIMSRYTGQVRRVTDINDIERLQRTVEALDGKVAGVFTEAPTNPLVETPDLEAVKDALGDIPLIVDVSSAGSRVIDVLPHADLVVESLTKFASGHGDIMMGSVTTNPDGPHARQLTSKVADLVELPYERDVQRIAHELADWPERTRQIGMNVRHLAHLFMDHPRIKAVYEAGRDRAAHERFVKLARNPLIAPGLITIDIKRSARPVYDTLDLSKGPSFGTNFTLNTDFVGIVYPQDLHDKEARAMLERQTGLNRNMIRVSVGTEDPNWLIDRYEKALQATSRS